MTNTATLTMVLDNLKDFILKLPPQAQADWIDRLAKINTHAQEYFDCDGCGSTGMGEAGFCDSCSGNNCENCDNPSTMYYCVDCEESTEQEVHDACGKTLLVDKQYHLNCNN